jgi:hypothetical protein
VHAREETTITRFEAKMEFGGDTSREDAVAWAEGISEKLPDGALLSLKALPLVLDLDEVTEEHAGNVVTIRGFYRKAGKLVLENAVENLSGVLEHVYPTGDAPVRRTFIIDGKAYDIPAYTVVELGEW